MKAAKHRGSIFVEDAEILKQEAFPGRQYIVRIRAPQAAAQATAGSFAHLGCGGTALLRRPLSIMRADRTEGWLEFLYRPLGPGLEALAGHAPGETISCLAPIGTGFAPAAGRPNILALGGGVGIPPMIFLADELRTNPKLSLCVLMGSEVPFPFELSASDLDAGALPADATHGLRLLEQWNIASRLASRAGLPGAHKGFVTELAEHHLRGLAEDTLERTQIFACGPEGMLRASAELAQRFALPCQLSLEEYMACGIGGCAGCTVLLHTDNGPQMKRVCVDGPVFDARYVYPILEERLVGASS